MKWSTRTWLKGPLFVTLLILLNVLVSGSEAATIRVPQDAPTIQEAISFFASGGDTVLVASGTYYENIDFSFKGVTLKSEQGPEVTIIDGRYGSTSVVTMSGGVLSGFTITNGHTSFWRRYFRPGGNIWADRKQHHS